MASPLASREGFSAHLNRAASRTAGLELSQVCAPHPSLPPLRDKKVISFSIIMASFPWLLAL